LVGACTAAEEAAGGGAHEEGVVGLVEIETLLHTGGDVKRLGDREVYGDGFNAAEDNPGEGSSGDGGDFGGDSDAKVGCDDGDGFSGGESGASRGTGCHDGQADTSDQDRGLDLQFVVDSLVGVVYRVGVLVEGLGHGAGGASQVLKPAVTFVVVASPEDIEGLNGIATVVLNQRACFRVGAGDDVIHLVGEGAPRAGRLA
jgi:hypothetical protein